MEDTEKTVDEQEVESTESNEEGSGEPTAFELIMKRFEDLEAKVDSTKPKEEDPESREEDPNYGFEPSRIVEEAAKAGQQGFRTLRRVESTLRKEFSSDLNDEQIDEILNALAAMPYKQLESTVANNGHLAMAYAHVGSAYKKGKLKAKTEKTETTPIGSETARVDSDSSNVLSKFEELYGAPSEATRKRLLEIAQGGVK